MKELKSTILVSSIPIVTLVLSYPFLKENPIVHFPNVSKSKPEFCFIIFGVSLLFFLVSYNANYKLRKYYNLSRAGLYLNLILSSLLVYIIGVNIAL